MNYFFIILAIIFMIYVYSNVKKQEFSIEESVFWVLGSLVLLILSIFYKSLDKIAIYFGVSYAPSFVFVIAIMFLLFMNFRNCKKLSKQKEKIIELAQRMSIIEFEMGKSKKGETDEKSRGDKK